MTLKVAVVGTGRVATESYLPHLSRAQDVTLSYYNRTQAKAEAAAQRFGGSAARTFEELLADQPDTVLVLTRENDRYEAAMALLALRPKRLFFEKPLVARRGQANVEEEDFHRAREILTEAQSAGTETAMVFNYRFFDQTQLARRIVRERNWGKPVHVKGLVHYACWSHCIDLLLLFAGPVAELTALGSHAQRPWGDERAPDVSIALRTEGDATGTLIGTCGLDWHMPLYELTFAFEGGRVSMRDLDGDMEVLDHATRRHELHALSREVSRWDQYRASFGKAVMAYLDTVRSGAPPPVPGIAGLCELQFEAAVKRSLAEERPVSLAAEFPLGLGGGSAFP